MAKVGLYRRMGFVAPDPTVSLSTSFAAIGVIQLDRSSASTLLFKGHLSGIYVYLDTVAGGATKVTVRVCRDSNGDECIVPDTEATLAQGNTTSNDASAAIKVDLDWVNGVAGGGDNVYTFIKTDAGTAKCNEVRITWTE